ncbi:hypothetical protein PoB_004070500 [Plakobranchus ocellatus]|uniref:Uncharacterized protein n=1 Tax=Plakobranchus ocellatus TaxID=259542 RepID=A0AAV4B0U1_9GAST|nr:hypothetical protein PoB_004070500 [Plakobranchus ocellatus]
MDPRCENSSERDQLCGGLRRRPVGPHSCLGGPREDSEGALHAAATGRRHSETKKVRVRSESDQLSWSPAWGGNNRPSGRKCGESSDCDKT